VAILPLNLIFSATKGMEWMPMMKNLESVNDLAEKGELLELLER
jgi:hypothetical protein